MVPLSSDAPAWNPAATPGDATLIVPLDRPDVLPDVRAPRPTVRLDSGPPGPARLAWRPGGDRVTPPLAGCVWRFVALAEAEDAEITAFADTYGVLRLGRNGRPQIGTTDQVLPTGQPWWEAPSATHRRDHGGSAGTADDLLYDEPLSGWRHYARRMRALLAVTADLRLGRPAQLGHLLDAMAVIPRTVSPDGLDAAFQRPSETAFDDIRMYALFNEVDLRSLAGQRRLVGHLVSELIAETGLQPAVTWDEPGTPQSALSLPATWVSAKQAGGAAGYWRVERSFDVLVAQFLAYQRSEWIYTCSLCGNPYELAPDRLRPRRDRRHFCGPECQREARLEVRKASEKRRYAKRKASQAQPAAAITQKGE